MPARRDSGDRAGATSTHVAGQSHALHSMFGGLGQCVSCGRAQGAWSGQLPTVQGSAYSAARQHYEAPVPQALHVGVRSRLECNQPSCCPLCMVQCTPTAHQPCMEGMGRPARHDGKQSAHSHSLAWSPACWRQKVARLWAGSAPCSLNCFPLIVSMAAFQRTSQCPRRRRVQSRAAPVVHSGSIAGSERRTCCIVRTIFSAATCNSAPVQQRGTVAPRLASVSRARSNTSGATACKRPTDLKRMQCAKVLISSLGAFPRRHPLVVSPPAPCQRQCRRHSACRRRRFSWGMLPPMHHGHPEITDLRVGLVAL